MPRKNADELILEPEGTMDIAKAAQVRSDLLEALEKGGAVTLKLAGVTDADLTFFQLLCAAHREAAKRGVVLHVDNTGIQENLERMFLDAGMVRQLDCQHASGQKCLWCGEGW